MPWTKMEDKTAEQGGASTPLLRPNKAISSSVLEISNHTSLPFWACGPYSSLLLAKSKIPAPCLPGFLRYTLALASCLTCGSWPEGRSSLRIPRVNGSGFISVLPCDPLSVSCRCSDAGGLISAVANDWYHIHSPWLELWAVICCYRPASFESTSLNTRKPGIIDFKGCGVG
ncbi:hypothetical protein P691DRAFT_275920 [Macrolepiota fuliginosa MF-IS2]|uniref:Uncharacterized protein n=1 Tax=Macrolepiota fuliginosa MF-IS2 TaxID=1400762 RepID=A0A9P6C8C6_9AGAR|nr:hypothetical protein P691DRAFT_275920 [Macrolepiota fuliginosa MF-IS2]